MWHLVLAFFISPEESKNPFSQTTSVLMSHITFSFPPFRHTQKQVSFYFQMVAIQLKHVKKEDDLLCSKHVFSDQGADIRLNLKYDNDIINLLLDPLSLSG